MIADPVTPDQVRTLATLLVAVPVRSMEGVEFVAVVPDAVNDAARLLLAYADLLDERCDPDVHRAQMACVPEDALVGQLSCDCGWTADLGGMPLDPGVAALTWAMHAAGR